MSSRAEQSLVLSLFPGIGLLDHAFELHGFCVVRGPDVLWGGDINVFHPPAGRFDGVIGGPPCQCFSSLARLVEANGHKTRFGNLIPEFERCIREAEPEWFLMENVPQAPVPVVDGYGMKSFLLDNSRLAGDGIFGLEQLRVRRFSFGMRGRDEVPSLMRWIDLALFLLPDRAGHVNPEALSTRRRQNAVLGASSLNPGCLGQTKAKKERQKGAGNAGKGRYRLPHACRLQGLPEDFLKDSPFTADGKLKAVANGVPLPMGLAVARAVKEAINADPT